MTGPVESAVRADLERWGFSEDTGLAASALDMARRLDAPDVRPAAASQLHAQLRPTLLELAELAAAVDQGDDEVDEVKAKRDRRRLGA